jgi:hypothetical protein
MKPSVRSQPDLLNLALAASCVDKMNSSGRIATHAEVAELADALRSGRSELYAHAGSIPAFGTRAPLEGLYSFTQLAGHASLGYDGG